MSQGPSPPLPDVNNPVLGPFWKATRDRRFVLRHCSGCGTAQWPPRPLCATCHGGDFDWRDADGRGEVFSYFVANRSLHPGFDDEVPYAAGAIELAGGLRMLGRIVGVDVDHVDIGMRVRARFVDRSPEVTLVYWEPDPQWAGAGA